MKKTNFTNAKLALVCGLLVFATAVKAQMVDTTVPQFHWAKNWGIYAGVDNIGTDQAGNVICAGLLTASADFDPGPDEFILTPGMEGLAQNAYISKFDANGNFSWAKKIEPDPNTPAAYDMYGIMGINSVAIGPVKGDIYIAGTFYGAMDLDPGPGVYTVTPDNDVDAFGDFWPSFFIVKLNANGDFLWGRKLDNYNGNNIHLAAYNNNGVEELFISGDYTQMTDPATDWTQFLQIDYDPGPGQYLVGGDPLLYGGDYGYLMKWDDNGNFEWFKKIADGVAGTPGIVLYDVGTPVFDRSGSMYMGGTFYGIMDISTNNTPYVVSSVDTLPTESTTSGIASEMFVSKYDHDGNLRWFKYSDAQPYVDAGMYYYPGIALSGLGVDSQSNLYIAPVFRGAYNLDRNLPLNGPATFYTFYNPLPQMGVYLPNYYASALMKYDSAGNFQWAKLFDNSESSGVANNKVSVSPGGEVYMIGDFRNDIDFDLGADTHIVHGPVSSAFTYLAKYDSGGNYLWAGRINTPVPLSDSVTGQNINDAVLDNQGNLIYGGMMWDTTGMDVDPTDAVFTLTSLEGMGEGYLVKLRLETTYTDTTTNTDTNTAIGNFAAMLNLKVFPNPNQGQLHIKSSKSLTNAGIQIYDISGKTVFERSGLNGMDFMCDLGGLPNGNYILRVTEGNRSASYKLVKQE